MAQPATQHTDAIMTNVSIAYRNSEYIADRLFNTLPVKKQSNKYYIYDKGPWFRDEADVRGPGARAKRGGYTLSTGSYYCEVQAFAKEIPDEDRANADVPLQPDIDATEFAADKVALKKERQVAAVAMTAANWTTTNDAEGGWAKGSSNTFISDMEDKIEVIRALIGMRPNVLVMDTKTMKELVQEATLLDRIKYGQTAGAPAMVTPNLIAQMFRLEEVIIGGAIYSDADEKADGTDFNSVDIWETNATKGSALLYYRPRRPGIKVAAAAYILRWTGNGTAGRNVLRWREDAEHQDVVEANEAFDCKVVGADCGCLFTDTIVT